MRVRRVLLVVMAVTSLAAVSPSAGADHSWGGYHWARTQNPFTLKLGDNVSATWDAHLAIASEDWSLSTVLDTVIVAGGTNPKQCRASAGRVEVCNARYGNNGWLGIAQIWISGTHIQKGVTKMNDWYFSSATYNTPAWRNLVMCQEIAHAFGLDHQDENFSNANLGTCMDYTSDPSTNQHPNGHDYEQLEIIYAHLDSTSTVDSSAAVSAQDEPGGNSPHEWGRPTHAGPDGRPHGYERDAGNGVTVLTYVIWA